VAKAGVVLCDSVEKDHVPVEVSAGEEVSMVNFNDVPGIDENDVRGLAHRLWEAEGQPDGRQDEFWYAARRQLEQSARVANGYVPPEPADPHPADENPSNVYNPAPGGVTVSEQHSRDLEADPWNPGSTA
jgi:Protein of unknown function (DUF2934)